MTNPHHLRNGIRPARGPGRAGMKALAACLGVGALAVAGCSSNSTQSSSSSSAAAAPAASTTPAVAGASTVVLRTTKLGEVLADPAGMTLYVFDKDQLGSAASACVGPCATNWSPLTATGIPMAAPGVVGQLTVLDGTSGTHQVAWNGKRLYRFNGDHAAGDTNGEGVGGVWHAVQPSAVSSNGSATTIAGVGSY